MIHTQIPNIKLISAHLTYLRDMLGAAEIAAFESETFLIMAKSGSPLDSDASEADDVERAKGVPKLDPERFEKISEIVKSFRKTCQKTGEQFYGFDAQFDGVTVVLEPMTRNTFAMVVGVDPTVGEYFFELDYPQLLVWAIELTNRSWTRQVQHEPGAPAPRRGRDNDDDDAEMRRVRAQCQARE